MFYLYIFLLVNCIFLFLDAKPSDPELGDFVSHAINKGKIVLLNLEIFPC